MRKLYLSFHLAGISLFFLSFFGSIIPSETTGDGKEVRVWEKGQVRHVHLALDPLIEAINLLNAVNVPDKYGASERGDGYESYLSQTVKKFFRSIPVSVGWFTILLSILFARPIRREKTKRGRARYLVIAGSIFTLVAVPLLAFDFYKHATAYEPYFHLGTGAYLIVSAYLLIGIALLGVHLSKEI